MKTKAKTNLKNKIVFLMYRYPLGVSSMIINSALMFAEKGFSVKIIIDERTFRGSPYLPSRREVKVHPVRELPRSFFWIYNRLVSFFGLGMFERVLKAKSLISQIDQFFGRKRYSFFLLQSRFFMPKNYDYLVGVEPLGLFSCFLLQESCPAAKLIYYNMELLVKNNLKTDFDAIKKRAEQYCINENQVDWIVLQNNRRKSVFLQDYNNHLSSKVALLRVAELGDAHREKSDFYYRKFGLPRNKKIILYSGNLQTWAYCEEIVRSTVDWPDNYVLIMHVWSKGCFQSDLHQKIVSSCGDNVHFCFDYLNADELNHAFSSADIGVALYKPIDNNFTDIEYSSNKIAQYVKIGLPIITNNYPGLVEVFEETGSGVCIADIGELKNAINRIFTDYDRFRNNAFRLYENDYQFVRYFDQFYDLLVTPPS